MPLSREDRWLTSCLLLSLALALALLGVNAAIFRFTGIFYFPREFAPLVCLALQFAYFDRCSAPSSRRATPSSSRTARSTRSRISPRRFSSAACSSRRSRRSTSRSSAGTARSASTRRACWNGPPRTRPCAPSSTSATSRRTPSFCWRRWSRAWPSTSAACGCISTRSSIRSSRAASSTISFPAPVRDRCTRARISWTSSS